MTPPLTMITARSWEIELKTVAKKQQKMSPDNKEEWVRQDMLNIMKERRKHKNKNYEHCTRIPRMIRKKLKK